MLCYENSPHDVECHVPDEAEPRYIEAEIKRGPWRGSNRRTDYRFKFRGYWWHGHCGERTCAFRARKGRAV